MRGGTDTEGPVHVSVLGLGYVGLPLVRACIAAGDVVVGYDTDDSRIQQLRDARSYVDDVADSELQAWLDTGFTPTTDPRLLDETDVFLICVPTPLSPGGGPDLSAVEAAVGLVAEHLDRTRRPLVVLESTTYPGTTEEVVKPILEKNDLVASQDFHLAFSPERIDPGNRTWTLENTPKLVGGLTPACTEAAAAFYEPLTVRVVRTKGLKEAEMAKLLENTYRHVNIALVNELWKVSQELGIDIWDAIDAAETKPYGFEAFRPGPGVGGHCIPIDPNYLSHRVRTELGRQLRLVELAQEINAGMPEFVVGRVVDALDAQGKTLRGALIGVLGVTYKRDVADVRETPAVPLVRQLRRLGAEVEIVDTYVESLCVDGNTFQSAADPMQVVALCDVVVVLQLHRDTGRILAGLDPDRVVSARGPIPGEAQ